MKLIILLTSFSFKLAFMNPMQGFVKLQTAYVGQDETPIEEIPRLSSPQLKRSLENICENATMDSHGYYEVEDMLMTEDQFKKYCNPDENDLLVRAQQVSCGNHYAPSCQDCPQGNGATWCNGECQWSSSLNQCSKPVNCGNHNAPSCQDCPQGNGEGWCNGDCKWSNDLCVSRFTGVPANIPDSILRVKVWYDDSFLNHPDIGDTSKAG